MRKAVALIALLLLALGDGPLPAATRKSHKKKSSAAATGKKSQPAARARAGTKAKPGATAKPGAKPVARTARGTRSRKGRTATVNRRPAGQTWRSRQLQPTPERYQEIQQALAQKGYLKQPASGIWDQSSTDALRRFQQDQKLDPTGKIDSLSLIALGLGPKRESTASASPTPAMAAPQGQSGEQPNRN